MAMKKKRHLNSRKIGELIDQMQELDDRMTHLSLREKKLNKRYLRMESELIVLMDKAMLNKAGGSKAGVTLRIAKHPSISHMGKFIKYVQRKKAFELFQRRVNSRAYFERLENNDPVPGVKVFEHTKVKLTKKRN